MRLTDALLFLPLAIGIHVGVWAVAPASIGASATGGPGQDRMTLAAASARHETLVETWNAPPLTASPPRRTSPMMAATALPSPAAEQAVPTLPPAAALPAVLPVALPQTDPVPPRKTPPKTSAAAPAQPQSSAPPKLHAPQTATDPAVQNPNPPRPAPPRPDALASADTNPPAAPPAPKPPPKAKAKPKESAASPATPQRTSGGGKAKKPQSGQAGKDATQSTNAATRNALRAKWGAKIQNKVLRRLNYPHQATGTGAARVALTINRSGRLTGLRLAKSSGVAAFDQAALNAVRRAGRFAKAPRALTEPSYTFSMSLTFRQ